MEDKQMFKRSLLGFLVSLLFVGGGVAMVSVVAHNQRISVTKQNKELNYSIGKVHLVHPTSPVVYTTPVVVATPTPKPVITPTPKPVATPKPSSSTVVPVTTPKPVTVVTTPKPAPPPPPKPTPTPKSVNPCDLHGWYTCGTLPNLVVTLTNCPGTSSLTLENDVTTVSAVCNIENNLSVGYSISSSQWGDNLLTVHYQTVISEGMIAGTTFSGSTSGVNQSVNVPSGVTKNILQVTLTFSYGWYQNG